MLLTKGWRKFKQLSIRRRSQTLGIQELIDDGITARLVEMEIDTMAGVRLDVSQEIGLADRWEAPLDGGGNGGEHGTARGHTVAAAEGQVAVAGEDEHGAFECVGWGCGCQAE